MRRSRSPIRYLREISPSRSPRHFSEFREGSFSISSLSSCSMGHSEKPNLQDNGTKTRDRDNTEKRRHHDRGDRRQEKTRHTEREKSNNRDRRCHSRSSHKIKLAESSSHQQDHQHEMEEPLDPSICNFQGQGSYQIVDDLEYESRKESTDRLDRLEKMIEMLVNKKVQPQSQPTNINSNVFMPESSENPYELNPRNTSFTTSMWLNKLNEECMEKNYDEKTCIQFMQSKMSGLVKAWFKTLNILDYTWPELKMLVTKTFPDNVDFAATLRLLVERYKRSDETITQYYFSKMYLIEACKITGANAVSCLIDGLADAYLEEQARSSNFLTPETLYSQFFAELPKFEQKQQKRQKPEDMSVSKQISRDMQRDVEFREEPLNEVSSILSRPLSMSMPKPLPMSLTMPMSLSKPLSASMQQGPPYKTAKKCYICRKVGHIAADCRHAPKCYRCNQEGHIAAKCSR